MRIFAVLCLAATLVATSSLAAGEVMITAGPSDEVMIPSDGPGRPPLTLPAGQTQLFYRNLIPDMIFTDLKRENFAFLDQKASEWRDKDVRMPFGGRRINHFYDGFSFGHTGDPTADDRLITALEDKVRRWIAQSPRSPTAHIGYAILLTDHAWVFRGAGYASSVTPEGWEKFHDYMQRAAAELMADKSYASADPYWYAAMLQIAREDSWEPHRYDQLLAEAIGRYPDYEAIYYEALTHFLPKWGGSWDSLDAFVNQAVRKTSATRGTQMYALLYSQIDSCDCDGQTLFAATRADWPRMKASFEELGAKHPDPWVRDEEAFFACAAGDRATLAALLPTLDPVTPQPDLWNGKLDTCKVWANDPKSVDGVTPLVPVPQPADTAAADPAPAALVTIAFVALTGWLVLMLFGRI